MIWAWNSEFVDFNGYVIRKKSIICFQGAGHGITEILLDGGFTITVSMFPKEVGKTLGLREVED